MQYALLTRVQLCSGFVGQSRRQILRRILRTLRENIAYNTLPYNFSAPGKAWGRRMDSPETFQWDPAGSHSRPDKAGQPSGSVSCVADGLIILVESRLFKIPSSQVLIFTKKMNAGDRITEGRHDTPVFA